MIRVNLVVDAATTPQLYRLLEQTPIRKRAQVLRSELYALERMSAIGLAGAAGAAASAPAIEGAAGAASMPEAELEDDRDPELLALVRDYL